MIVNKILNQKNIVLGSRGLVGSALVSKLNELGCKNVFEVSRAVVDLTSAMDCYRYFEEMKQIDNVFICAAKVGGILANWSNPVPFIMDNLKIQMNVLENCNRIGVKKVIFLGSSCIYPKMSKQPIKEEYLMTGLLETTNSAYAVAKIAGIEMCKSYYLQNGANYIAAMPTNLFGPRDNFDLNTSHVIPALIRKFHEAKENNTDVILWGDGSALREFLHVNDLVDALIFLAENHDVCLVSDLLVNIGFGKDITIRELSEVVRKVVGFEGEVKWDTTKPNGTPKKLLDSSKIFEMGWQPNIGLEEGLKSTYEWYFQNK